MLGFARGDVRLLRFGYWSLLVVALPGWILMRIGAQWIYSKEGWDDVSDIAERGSASDIVTAEGGGIVLLVSLIVGGIGVRRLRDGRGAGLLRATMMPLARSCSPPTSPPSGRWPASRTDSVRPTNDHGLHTREPAIGRQIQGSPLALRRSLRRTSSDFLRMCASAFVKERPGTCPSPTR